MSSLRGKKKSLRVAQLNPDSWDHAHSPSHALSHARARRSGAGRGTELRATTCPRYFSPDVGAPQLHPRGLPDAGGYTPRQHRRPALRPARPARWGLRARAGGSRRAGGAQVTRRGERGKGARLHSRARGRHRSSRGVAPVQTLKRGAGRAGGKTWLLVSSGNRRAGRK